MELLAASEIPAAPVLIVMAIGVLVAIFGHASKSHGTVLLGLMMLFIATAAMFVGAYTAYNDDPADPRPECKQICPKEDEENPPGSER